MMRVALLCAAMLFVNPALAQSFGFHGGEPIGDLQLVGKPASEYEFEVRPPEPDRNFDKYFVLASDQLGVCRVLGVSAEMSQDRLDDLVAETILALERRYRTSVDTSFFKYTFWYPTKNLTLVDVDAVHQRLVVRYVFHPEGDCVDGAPSRP